jgi:membrane protease YdiL (CAAX protease family)
MGTLFLNLTNQGKNGALRWLGGTVIVLFLWLIVGGIVTAPFLLLAGAVVENGSLTAADPFWLYIALSVGFPFIWLGLWLVVRFIHRRDFRTLITPAPRISGSRLAQGFAVWLVLLALAQLAEFAIFPARVQWTFDPARWLFFLPFVLVLTPIQTSAEELLFRGYLLQGTGRLTHSVSILCILNGVLFSLPHMLNPEVVANPGSALLLFANYSLTGAVLALFTLRDNRLELALGAHASNNLFTGLIVNYKDSALTTPSILTNPVLDAASGLVALIAISLAFYLIFFRVWGRRVA